MDTAERSKRVFETLYGQSDKVSISLSHPKFKGRADRLDLITNQMVGFKAAVGDKNFTICDLSETGFSYAEKVPVKKNLSYKQVKVKVDQVAVSNYGKNLKYLCFYEGFPERGAIEAKGTIKNHTLFLILSSDEIKRTVTSYLQSKAIRRSHDPDGYFKKLDMILAKTDKLRKNGYSETTLGIVMNTTFQNLILEIGAPIEIFDKLYQGYINKPVYVKYGVAIDEKKSAFQLLKFAELKNTAKFSSDKTKMSVALQKRKERIEVLNNTYSFKDFILIVWKNCLSYFRLDSDLVLPKIDKEKVAQLLKQEMYFFNGHLEKIADPEFIEGDYPGLLQYFCDGLYWFLIEKDKKYFDREVVKKEIRAVVNSSYEACLRLGQNLN